MWIEMLDGQLINIASVYRIQVIPTGEWDIDPVLGKYEVGQVRLDFALNEPIQLTIFEGTTQECRDLITVISNNIDLAAQTGRQIVSVVPSKVDPDDNAIREAKAKLYQK